MITRQSTASSAPIGVPDIGRAFGNKRSLHWLAAAVAAALLSGCAGGGASESAGRDLGAEFARSVDTTVFFASNSVTLDATAQAKLDAQAAFIRQYPQLWFKVEGHADRVGSPAYNRDLGLRRANAALDYLVSRGVNREQLEALVSFGEERPAIETEAEERRNRRVVTDVGGLLDPECNCRRRPGVE